MNLKQLIRTTVREALEAQLGPSGGPIGSRHRGAYASRIHEAQLKSIIREQVRKALREYNPGEGYTEIPKLINDIKTYLETKKFTVEDHGEIQGDNFQPIWKKVDAQFRSEQNKNIAGIAIDEGNVEINVVIGINVLENGKPAIGGGDSINLLGTISNDIKQIVTKSGTGMKVGSAFGLPGSFSKGLSAIIIEMP